MEDQLELKFQVEALERVKNILPILDAHFPLMSSLSDFPFYTAADLVRAAIEPDKYPELTSRILEYILRKANEKS